MTHISADTKKLQETSNKFSFKLIEHELVTFTSEKLSNKAHTFIATPKKKHLSKLYPYFEDRFE